MLASESNSCYFRNRISLVNKGQNILYKLSFDATAGPHPIGNYRIRCIQIYFHLPSEYCQTTAFMT